MDPFHQVMARPQVADGGTASNVEDSAQPTKDCTRAWGLGDVFTTPHCKNWFYSES